MLNLDYLSDIQDAKRPAEQRLWIGVLLITCRDAQGIGCWHQLEVDKARRWLLADQNPDREIVCDLAGVSEHSVLSWANRTLQFVGGAPMSNDSDTGRTGATRVA